MTSYPYYITVSQKVKLIQTEMIFHVSTAYCFALGQSLDH